MLTFQVEQFRCFHKPRPVQLNKITLLVGENSTGKSSFLAAVRSAVEIFNMRDPNFNEEPFNLGAYDQIAHHRGRTRAREFSFEVTEGFPADLRSAAEQQLRRVPQRLRIRISFIKKSAQPSVNAITVSGGVVSARLLFNDKDRLMVLRTPTRLVTIPRSRLEEEFRSFSQPGPSLQVFYYFFDRLVFGPEVHKGVDRDQSEKHEMALLRGMLHRAVTLLGGMTLEVAAPIRTKPRRTYDPKSERPDPEGEYIPYLLARLKAEKSTDWSKLKTAFANFGIAAGMFDEIEIKRKGVSDSDPFQVLVKRKVQSSNLIDVGYGVSQILPVLAEIILADARTIHLIQQPEVHLHPRAQAEFATFLKDSFSDSPSYCIVETHSDFIVDRLRSHIAAGELKKEDVSLIFFDRKDKQVELHQISLDENGNIHSAPKGYRDFFQKEMFRNLGIGDVPVS